MSLVAFSHTVFALPFALIGFFLGLSDTNSQVDYLLFFKIIICMITARSAAMAFNRWADARIDALNNRTKIREIPAGIISKNAALALVVFCCLIFVIVTFFINIYCFYLSPLALVIILGYSYTKRFTSLCHFILGMGLALAPIGAYLATTATFSIQSVLLGVLVLFWVTGFDILYSLQDQLFDTEHKLHSVPVLLGAANAMLLSRSLHFLVFCLLLLIGFYFNHSYFYFVGSFAFAFLLYYQHSIIKVNDLSRIDKAFGTTNGVASIILFIFFSLDLFYTNG